MEIVAADLGFGNGKVRDKRGGTIYAAHVSHIGLDFRIDEGGQDDATCVVEFDSKKFLVGKDAPIKGGKSLSGLDLERIVDGSDEILATTYATWGNHMLQNNRRWTEPISLHVGVPASLMIGEAKTSNIASIKAWLCRNHEWSINGADFRIRVDNVTVRTQAAGAISDMAYTLEGKQTRDAQYIESGFAVISIGYNTVETSGGIGGMPIGELITSMQGGVSSMLAIYRTNDEFDIPVLEWKLRRNQLNGHLPTTIDTWSQGIVSHVTTEWKKKINLVQRIILVGGGARYAEPALRNRFGDKIWMPDDPIGAIARGLYKRAVYDAKAK